MTRSLSAPLQAAVVAGNVRPALFLEADFDTGTIYIWSGFGTINWNSVNWTGVGDLLGIDKISEDSQVSARGLKVTLNGIPGSAISTAMLANYRTRMCKVWLGAFDASMALITPALLFAGRMDQMTINDGADTCSIDLTVESRLLDLQRQRERRFTDQDQQFFFPGDLFLRYVAGLQDQPIYWGQQTPTPSSAAAQANSGPNAAAAHARQLL